MDIAVNQVEYKSANLKSNIRGYIYSPLIGDIKGILQISHGMCEYITRYDDFMRYLVNQGFVVCGNDHIGHGKSIGSKSERGYFAKENGDKYLVDDLYKMMAIVKKQYPDIPYFLLGHSMGSFIARLYAAEHGRELDGLILCGTGGKNPLVSVGLAAAKSIAKLDGEYKSSKFIKKLCFGEYNKKCLPHRTASDWLTRDTKIIDEYRKDDLSNFDFTNSGYVTLLTLIKRANQIKAYEKTPRGLPVYLIAGDMDPVGDYGKGVKEVFTSYMEVGMQDVEIKLYEGARHEIINEINRAEVYKDIENWLIGQASKSLK